MVVIVVAMVVVTLPLSQVVVTEAAEKIHLDVKTVDRVIINRPRITPGRYHPHVLVHHAPLVQMTSSSKRMENARHLPHLLWWLA